MSELKSETARIKTEYERRDSTSALAALYSPANPSGVYIRQQAELYIADYFFRRFAGLKKPQIEMAAGIHDMKLLDIGTGAGSMLQMFSMLGFPRENLYGADLMFDRARAAAQKNATSNVINCNASLVPIKDSSFDFVSQFTVFSFVISAEMKKRIASEMVRVAKPGATVIWYDMIHTNPFNKNLKGVGYAEICRLFGVRPRECHRIVLNPWILRPLFNFSKTLCDVLAALKIFNSFYIAFIKVKK
ncbi:MAG TPA: class I SAM-dependent methyltransferase [Candidatus Wallbacteria bacterium]|nr:class I SAM-dependent methyltransferase [Candidatus Wallbacteria bacterium]